jgi:hypothetical protein
LAELMMFLNILGITLLVLISLCLLILIIPIRYKLDGWFLDSLRLNFNLRFSPLFIVKGNLTNTSTQALHMQVILLGIPITMHPEKWKKKEQKKESDKKKKRKKKSKSPFLNIIDRDLRVRGMALVGDLLRILKPDKFEVNGVIGFDEPHLTGWLAALCYSLKSCCKNTLINIEPFWDEEHYDFNFLLEGKIIIGQIILKIAGFAIGRWFHNAFSRQKEKVNLS